MGKDLSQAELDFFIDDPQKLQIYLRVREQLLLIAPDSALRVMKTCVTFDAPKPFVYVSYPFRKRYKNWPEHHLILSFSADQPYEHGNLVAPAFIRPGLYTLHALIPEPVDIPSEIHDLITLAHARKNGRSTP